MADKEKTDLHQSRFRYLDYLYVLAQVLTVEAQEAVKLVEATFDRACTITTETHGGLSEKAWLIQLMLQIHRSPSHLLDSEISSLAGSPELIAGTETMPEGFRSRLVEQFVDRALPAAFLMLPEQKRLLLVLCDVDLFTCDKAARILGLDPLDTAEILAEARDDLSETLRTNATTLEQQLLSTNLPPNWQQRALRTLVTDAFLPLPPTLRPAILASEHADAVTPAAPAERDAAQTVDPGPARPRSKRHTFKHVLISSLVIACAGLLAYTLSSVLQTEPDTNLLSVSADLADQLQITFRTNSPEQAERYVYDRLDWRLIIPGINRTTLEGVCISEIVQSIEAPVLLYADTATNEQITVFVYSYALLDRMRDRAVLQRDVLQQIEETGHFDLYDLNERKLLLWRNQDEIFVAVTSGSAEDLRQRIFFPS